MEETVRVFLIASSNLTGNLAQLVDDKAQVSRIFLLTRTEVLAIKDRKALAMFSENQTKVWGKARIVACFPARFIV